MLLPFFPYHFFHNKTVDRTEGGLVYVSPNPNDWPESWRKISYKQYRLFQPVALPNSSGPLFDGLLSKRRSSTKYFLLERPSEIPIETWSYILKCGYGLQGCPREELREENRTVPSGGRRYPLELYVFLFRRVSGCRPGIYHYGIREHTLEPIVHREFSKTDISLITPHEYLHEAHGMICMTGVFERTTGKYGSRGYRYVLIEAGHVAQNMLLAGTERGINMIPIGGTNEKEIEEMLRLKTLDERVVYTVFI